MGYYSAVKMSMTKEKYNKLLLDIKKPFGDDKSKYTEEQLKTTNELIYLINSAHVYESEGEVVLSYKYIKWYKEFSDIDYIMNYIKNDKEIAFLRIGECQEDVEEYNNDDDQLWTEMRIYSQVEDRILSRRL